MANRTKTGSRYLVRYSIVLVAIWSVVILSISLWDIYRNKKEDLENANHYTKVGFEKDLLYRRWAAMHGGVYVPVTENTQPNPYLADIPERDIITPSGRKLTLMNPAYMTRQVYEIETVTSAVRSHITSLNPVRPENKPDAWERKALEAFQQGENEIVSLDTIYGREYFRLMRPMITEAACLKCHEKDGYKLNDIRGGISVSYPMENIRKISESKSKRMFWILFSVWILGICSLVVGYSRLKKIDKKRQFAETALKTANDNLERKVLERTAELRKSDSRYKSLYENVPTMNFNVDNNGIVLSVNKFGAESLGYKPEELIGQSVLTVFPEELRKDVTDQINTCFNNPKQLFDWEILKICKDGKLIWVREVARVMESTEFKDSLFIACQDITIRKNALDTLEEHKEHLEELVKERTTELELRNAELERLNKLFVGREIRMGELKKEIEELKKNKS